MSELNQNNGQTTGDQGSVSFNLGNMSEPTSMPEQPMPQTVEPDNGVSDLNIAEVTTTPTTPTEQASGFSKRMKLIIAALIGFAVLTGLVAVYFLGGDLFRGSLTTETVMPTEAQLKEAVFIDVNRGEGVTQCQDKDADCLFVTADDKPKSLNLAYGFDFQTTGTVEATANLYLLNRDEKKDSKNYYLKQDLKLVSNSNGYVKINNQAIEFKDVPSDNYKVYLQVKLTKFTRDPNSGPQVAQVPQNQSQLEVTNSPEFDPELLEPKPLEGFQVNNEGGFQISQESLTKQTATIVLDPAVKLAPEVITTSTTTINGKIINEQNLKLKAVQIFNKDRSYDVTLELSAGDSAVVPFSFNAVPLSAGENQFGIVAIGENSTNVAESSYNLLYTPTETNAEAEKTVFIKPLNFLIPTAKAQEVTIFTPEVMAELVQQNRVITTNARSFANRFGAFVLIATEAVKNESIKSADKSRSEIDSNNGEIEEITIQINANPTTLQFANVLNANMFSLELPDDATTDFVISNVTFVNPKTAKLKIKTAPNKSHNRGNQLAINIAIKPSAFTQVSNITAPQKLPDPIAITFKDPVVNVAPQTINETAANDGTLEKLTVTIAEGAKFKTTLSPDNFQIPTQAVADLKVIAVTRTSETKAELTIKAATKHQAADNKTGQKIMIKKEAFLDNDSDVTSTNTFNVQFLNNTIVEEINNDEDEQDLADEVDDAEPEAENNDQVIAEEVTVPNNNQNTETKRLIIQPRTTIDRIENDNNFRLDLNNLGFDLEEISENNGQLPELAAIVDGFDFKEGNIDLADATLSENARNKGIRIKSIVGDGNDLARISLEATTGHTKANDTNDVTITFKRSAFKPDAVLRRSDPNELTSNKFDIHFLDPVATTTNTNNNDNTVNNPPANTTNNGNVDNPPVNNTNIVTNQQQQQPTIVRETTAPVVTTPSQSTQITTNETTQFDRVVTTFDNGNTDPRIVRQSAPDAQADIISSPGIQGTTGPAALAYPLLAAGSFFLARRKARK